MGPYHSDVAPAEDNTGDFGEVLRDRVPGSDPPESRIHQVMLSARRPTMSQKNRSPLKSLSINLPFLSSFMEIRFVSSRVDAIPLG